MLSPSFYDTLLGSAYLGDSLTYLKQVPDSSVNLVITSPPFALNRKKEYGNVTAAKYIEWFLPFAEQIKRVICDTGSFVLEIGGSWVPGLPIRSLYHLEIVSTLCREFGFNLAQEFYWHNPAKLPSPAEWVTVRRVRVKDSVTPIWWLSKTPDPKANNFNVLQPYSKAMETLLRKGYAPKSRPSGHTISDKFMRPHKGAIPPNLLTLANTSSNDHYLKACRAGGLKPHPARFHPGIPEFFIKFLTSSGDLICDPFAGSNVVGAVAEKLGRRWLAFEIVEEYLVGSTLRFIDSPLVREAVA